MVSEAKSIKGYVEVPHDEKKTRCNTIRQFEGSECTGKSKSVAISHRHHFTFFPPFLRTLSRRIERVYLMVSVEPIVRSKVELHHGIYCFSCSASAFFL